MKEVSLCIIVLVWHSFPLSLVFFILRLQVHTYSSEWVNHVTSTGRYFPRISEINISTWWYGRWWRRVTRRNLWLCIPSPIILRPSPARRKRAFDLFLRSALYSLGLSWSPPLSELFFFFSSLFFFFAREAEWRTSRPVDPLVRPHKGLRRLLQVALSELWYNLAKRLSLRGV